MIAKTRLTTTTTGNHPAPPPLNCPRCDSPNTKFCYYNNYSLSQPRHFCKSCKRYWTRGGTLRNVPVGGSSRKNKRAKKHPISTTPTLPPPPQLIHPTSADFNSLFYPPFKFDLELDGKYCYGAQSIIPNNNSNLVELPKSTHNPWDEFPIEIPVTAAAAAAESSYVYWNQAGWPETGGSSSMASLF